MKIVFLILAALLCWFECSSATVHGGHVAHNSKNHKQTPTMIGDQLKAAAEAHVEAAAAIKDAAEALKQTAQSLKQGAEEVAETSEEEERLKTAIKTHIVQSHEELARLEASVSAAGPAAAPPPPPPPPMPFPPSGRIPHTGPLPPLHGLAPPPAAAFNQKKAVGLRKKNMVHNQ